MDNAFTNSNGQKLLRVPLSRYLKMKAAARGEKPGSDVSDPIARSKFEDIQVNIPLPN